MVRKTGTTPRRGRGVVQEPIGSTTAHGLVRIYADVDEAVSIDLAVLAAKRRLSKKAMLELLIVEAARNAR